MVGWAAVGDEVAGGEEGGGERGLQGGDAGVVGAKEIAFADGQAAVVNQVAFPVDFLVLKNLAVGDAAGGEDFADEKFAAVLNLDAGVGGDGGITGDFPICVVPMLEQDVRREDVRKWAYFCQISDSTTSYGSYSGVVPNE